MQELIFFNFLFIVINRSRTVLRHYFINRVYSVCHDMSFDHNFKELIQHYFCQIYENGNLQDGSKTSTPIFHFLNFLFKLLGVVNPVSTDFLVRWLQVQIYQPMHIITDLKESQKGMHLIQVSKRDASRKS